MSKLADELGPVLPEGTDDLYLVCDNANRQWVIRSLAWLQKNGTSRGKLVYRVDLEALELYPIELHDYRDVNFLVVEAPRQALPPQPVGPVLPGDDTPTAPEDPDASEALKRFGQRGIFKESP